MQSKRYTVIENFLAVHTGLRDAKTLFNKVLFSCDYLTGIKSEGGVTYGMSRQVIFMDESSNPDRERRGLARVIVTPWQMSVKKCNVTSRLVIS